MECKPNSHSSCIQEPCTIGNKDPEIVTAPQVLVCALTGHIEITAKRYGNTATSPQWDDHPLFSSPNWCWPEILPV